MMLTFDLKAQCHRIEIFALPSYDQMNKDESISCQALILPYKIDLNIAPGSIQNVLITGHFHQLTCMVENKTEQRDILILQYFDSIISVDLQNIDKEDSVKLLLELEESLVLQNRAANLKILQTDISNLLKRDLKQILSVDQKKFLESGCVLYYFVLQPSLSGNTKNYSIWLIEVSNQKQPVLGKQIVYQFSFSGDEKFSEVLQMSLSNEDSEEPILLILNRQFVVQKLKLVIKSNQIMLVQIDKTIKNEEAEKIWSDLLHKDDQLQLPDTALNFKNLNPREIVLTCQGIYLEAKFFSIIFESNIKKESMLEFESKRDKILSTILNDSSQMGCATDLNTSGALQSPDQSSLLLYFRRQKLSQKALSDRKQSTMNRQTAQSRRFTTHKSKLTSNQANDNISQENFQRGIFFLSLPLVTSKLKQIMPLDNFSKEQVEYTTFLGTKTDDILVKLKSYSGIEGGIGARGNLGFLIFSSKGQLKQIEEAQDLKDQDLRGFSIQQFFLCMKPIKGADLRGLAKNSISLKKRNLMKELQERRKDEKKVVHDKEVLYMKVLMVNKSSGKYQILNIFWRSEVYCFDTEYKEPQMISPTGLLKAPFSDEQIIILKLQFDSSNGKIHLIRFLFDNKYMIDQKQKPRQSLKNRQQSTSIKENIQNFNVYLSIDDQQISLQEEDLIEKGLKQSIQDSQDIIKSINKLINQYSTERTNSRYNSFKIISDDDENQTQLLESSADKEELEEQSNFEILPFKNNEFDIFLHPVIDNNQEDEQKYFFFFRIQNKLHYQEVEIIEEQNKRMFSLTDEDSKLVQINFREPGFISQILEVRRQDQLQIMYCELETCNFYLIQWDINHEEEVSMQVFQANKFNPFYQIFKGAQINDNYLFFMGSDTIQDLRMEMPSNFLSGKMAWKGFNSKPYQQLLNQNTKGQKEYQKKLLELNDKYADELKVSYSCSKSLGIASFAKCQLQRSYSYLDLQYLKYIFETFLNPKVTKEDQKKPLILDYLSVQLPKESNIMHYFATNQLFLDLYLEEIQSLSSQQNFKNEKYLSYAYYGLFPNYFTPIQTSLKGRRPFSIALKANNIACLETIIRMLMSDPKMCYIRDIKHSLQQLLGLVMNSNIVHQFIENHSLRKFWYQHEDAQNIVFNPRPSLLQIIYYGFTCRDPNSKEFRVFATQHLNGSDFIKEKVKPKKSILDKFNMNAQKESNTLFKKNYVSTIRANSKYNEIETLSDDEKDQILLYNIKKYSKKQNYEDSNKRIQEKHQITYYSFDFEGILYGKKGEEFLKFIFRHGDNTKIFDLKYIQFLIDYQWSQVSRNYYIIKGLISVKNVFILGYILYLQSLIICPADSKGDLSYECSQSIVNNINNSKWDDFSYPMLFVLVPIMAFFILQEVSSIQRAFNKFTSISFMIIDFLFVLKLTSDIYLLVEYRSQYFKNYLQAEPLKEDYWKYTHDSFHSPLKKEYLMRYTGSNMFIIKTSNAVLILVYPMILMYNWRFHPFVSKYISKFFFVMKKLLRLMLFFSLIFFFMLFSYKTVSVLNYNEPIDISQDKSFQVEENIKAFVVIMSVLNSLFKETIVSGIMVIIALTFLFTGIAMTRENEKAGQNRTAQRLVENAQIMYEGDMLKNNASKLMKTRYIVEVVPHGNGKNTLKKEDDEEETDFLTNNEQDSSAS